MAIQSRSEITDSDASAHSRLDVYVGRVRRRCPDCGVEVEIEKPTRVLAKSSTRSWRKKARQEVQRQLLWQAMCPRCRAWWNSTLRKIEADGADGHRDAPCAAATDRLPAERLSLSGTGPGRQSPRAAAPPTFEIRPALVADA
jgi:predicted RNA-binding Zn-ribbon protein involved in translation (DUF1610 family)